VIIGYAFPVSSPESRPEHWLKKFF
jgi:hypothetical protein